MQQLKRKPLLLIFPFNVLAHYLRCLTLAAKLEPFFEIQFLQTEQYSSFINERDYKTFCCKTFDADYVQACIRRFDFSWLNKEELETVYVEQVSVIENLQPYAVLGDTMPTLKMAAERTGVKYISLMNGYISRYHADVHQMPASHPLYKYVKVLPVGVQDFFVEIGEQKSYREIHRPFNEIRNKYALSKKYSYEDELEGDVNLLCDLPELFPQKKLPVGYYEIPPLFYTSNEKEDEVVRQLDKNKKTLFVSMGSTGEWQNVHFLNHPYFEKYNIVTAGDRNHIINTRGVIKAPFVNIHQLFPHTDLVICHGGNGTIYQALMYGIPLLCRTSHFEQQWNVNKLESVRLGKSLDNIKKTGDYIGAVEFWLSRKRSDNFIFIEHKIREALQNFPYYINEIIENLFSQDEQWLQIETLHETKKIA
jgi:UDP:flavonoid glycosyltransferase YjiC (YdhE family)